MLSAHGGATVAWSRTVRVVMAAMSIVPQRYYAAQSMRWVKSQVTFESRMEERFVP